MSLAETLEKSDFQMNEADRAEFVERVLVDGEEIVAAFECMKAPFGIPRSIVFTTSGLSCGNRRKRARPVGKANTHSLQED